MHELLHDAYGLHIQDEVTRFGRHSYIDGESLYFIIKLEKKEACYIEQCMLARFLREQGCRQIALPIQNHHHSWITNTSHMYVIVFKLPYMNVLEPSIPFQHLATFHKISQTFPFEPQYMNDYGFWSTIWQDQVITMKRQVEKAIVLNNSTVLNTIIDNLPEFMRLSKLAIQLLTEAENESYFNRTDKPAICFNRYEGQQQTPIILPIELVYDHPVRDIAEQIRYYVLHNTIHRDIEVKEWLERYQAVQPLSTLGMRMLYARLLYPSHFWEMCDWMIAAPRSKKYVEVIERLIKRHRSYLNRVNDMFK